MVSFLFTFQYPLHCDSNNIIQPPEGTKSQTCILIFFFTLLTFSSHPQFLLVYCRPTVATETLRKQGVAPMWNLVTGDIGWKVQGETGLSKAQTFWVTKALKRSDIHQAPEGEEKRKDERVKREKIRRGRIGKGPSPSRAYFDFPSFLRPATQAIIHTCKIKSF